MPRDSHASIAPGGSDVVTPSELAQLRRFWHTMRGSRDKKSALEKARQWLPATLYQHAIQWILAQRVPVGSPIPSGRSNTRILSLGEQLFPSLFPASVRELYRYRPLKSAQPWREIRWAGALIAVHAERINQFIELRSSFEHALLSGQGERALQLLDDIEQSVGYSYWLIKTRLATLQLIRGLEAQKIFATTVKKAARRPGVTGYITHHSSVRNEPSVTPARFTGQLRKQIDGLSLPADLRTFVSHHVAGPSPATSDVAIDVLRHSCAASVIDAYEALLFTARVVLANESRSLWPSLEQAIRYLQRTSLDARLTPLIFGLTEEGPEDSMSWAVPSDASLSSFEAFLGGDDARCADVVARAVKTDPTDIYAIQVGARCSIQPDLHDIASGISSASVAATLLTNLRVVVRRDGQVDGAATEISRIALNFAGFTWADAAEFAVARELSSLPDDIPGPFLPATAAVASELEWAARFSNAAQPISHPLRLESTHAEARAQYAATMPHLSGIVQQWADALIYDRPVDSTQLSRANRALATVGIAVRGGDWKSAVAAANDLLSEPGFYRQRAVRIVAYGLLRQGLLAQCVSFVAKEFVRDEALPQILPIREIADRLDRTLRRELGADLSLSILFDAYSRHVDGAYDRYRRRAYEDVLRGLGVERPTQLRSIASKLDPLKLQYYLWRICVPEIMYASTAYAGGSRELQEERVAVLQWLSELDPPRTEEYQEEILERTRRLVLQTRRAEVEQSRIQVDPDAFQKGAEKRLRETYERYMAFRTGGLVDARWREALADAIEGNVSSLMAVLATPENEPAELFGSIVRELRDEFVGNRDYGLDGFLSTRIRHGTLASELRSPLLAARIVTPFDEAAGAYRPNDYWLSSARGTHPARAARLEQHFANFARAYDALLDEITSKWVQVRRDSSSPGLIDLSLSAEHIRVLENLTGLERDFSGFAATVFDTLVQRLEPGLAAIRTRIVEVAKPRALQLLTALIRGLSRDAGQIEVRELIRATQGASTDVQHAFDRVASWFTLSKQVSGEPLALRDAVEIAVGAAQRLYPGFRASLQLGSAASSQVEAQFLAHYFYIFLILFENAVRHAGFGNDLIVSVHCERVEGALIFKVENDVSAEVDQEEARLRIMRIQSAIDDSRYVESLATEGRTGFHKMYKIVRHDFLRVEFDPGLKLGFSEDRQFVVHFRLPLARGA